MAIEHEKKGNGMADKKKHSEGLMRLDKFLTEMGKGSRSEVKEMARRGRIQINGHGKSGGYEGRSRTGSDLSGWSFRELCQDGVFYAE